MSERSVLRQAAHRIMLQEVDARGTSDEIALAAVTVYTKLFVLVSSAVGEAGTHALFRNSLRRTAFTFFKELHAVEREALLHAIRACVSKQQPDMAVEAAIALLTAFVELLATFIGLRVTCTLLHDVWPDVCTPQAKEAPE
jgi:hypothetical protein